MARRGRRTTFHPAYCKQAGVLAGYGLKLNQIAQALGVTPQTISGWRNKYPEFDEAITSAKLDIDRQVEAALFQRATGYDAPDTHVSQFEGRIIKTPLIKHYPPDITAASLWLRNRQPQRWRDKTEIEHAGTVSVVQELAIAIVQERKKAGVNTSTAPSK